MILVATIEHSGTFTLLDLLGYEKRRMRPLSEFRDGDGMAFAHLWDSEMPRIRAWSGPIITTDRPVDDIRRSWQRRGKDLRNLDAQLANYAELRAREPYVVTLGRKWQ